jgi:hypothetical protein
MTDKDAMKLALEALENQRIFTLRPDHEGKELTPKQVTDAITALKERLAQPEQPEVRTGNCLRVGVCASEGHKIQPQRTWVGLTDEEKAQFVVAYYPSHWDRKTAVVLMSDYEKYLKEKNNV